MTIVNRIERSIIEERLSMSGSVVVCITPVRLKRRMGKVCRSGANTSRIYEKLNKAIPGKIFHQQGDSELKVKKLFSPRVFGWTSDHAWRPASVKIILDEFSSTSCVLSLCENLATIKNVQM